MTRPFRHRSLLDDQAVERWTWEFVDRDLETTYRAEAFAQMRPHAPTITLVMTLALVVLGVGDLVIVPDDVRIAWTLRYGVLLPVWLILAIAMRTRWFSGERAADVVMTFLIASLVGFLVAIALVADPPGSWMYAALMSATASAAPTLGRMRVRSTIGLAVAMLFLSTLIGVLIADPDEQAVRGFLVGLTVLSATVGVLASSVLEMLGRRSFLRERALEGERARADALLANILPAPIAERLKRGERVIADRIEDATVLFADIVGFTRRAEGSDPTELVATLDRIFARFDDLTEAHGLEKIKTVGDGYVAAGGLPGARAVDHTRAAVDLAVAMVAAVGDVRAEGDRLQVRVGVHVGPLVAGVIGRHKFSYDLWGDTVNVASRMESHGAPGRVQISADVADRVRDAYDLEPRGEVVVKGKGRMTTWFVTGPTTTG